MNDYLNNLYGAYTPPTATQPYGYPMPMFGAYRPPMQYAQPQAPAQPQQQPAPQTTTNIIYVNGIEDVRNRLLPNNSITFFMDNDRPLAYIKTVDEKGQFVVKAISLSDYEEPKPEPVSVGVTKEEFDKKIKDIEDNIAKLSKSSERTSKQSAL